MQNYCIWTVLFCSLYIYSSTRNGAQRCSSIFIEKPGGGEEVVYAPSGQNATFTCAVNASELLWELNMLNPEIPRHANELEENGIVSGSLKNVGELLCSTLTVLVSDYSHNADICCQGRRASNTLETCCTRLLEYGRPLQPSLELPQYLRESGSVNLSWTANVSEGVEHYYTIVTHSVISTSQEVLVETTTSLHYMFDECGEFDIQVIAVNGAGQSAPSNTVRVSLPLLPDITPVSQSLKHRVWKVDGRIMVLITFEPPYFCAEQRVTTYCVQMNTIQFRCINASETEVHLGEENGLIDNTFYEYTTSAVNKLGVSTSTTRNLTTSDIESVIARMITERVIEVQCYFITGSDAKGCMVVIASELPSVSNITATLIKTNQSDTVVNDLLNITVNMDCYHNIFAFDIEANSSISSLAISGELPSNMTNKCMDNTNASNSVAITWSVIGVVSVLIIGILLASFVTIMLSRFYAKQKADPPGRQNTEKEEDIVTTPSDAYGVIHRST